MIIEQYTDIAGKIRIIWETSTGEHIPFKFNTQPTEQELEDLGVAHLDSIKYQDEDPFSFDILEHKELLKELVQLFKQNPGMTGGEFNTWLDAKLWWEQGIINYFIFKLARLLEDSGVDVGNFTSGQVYNVTSTWLHDTPNKRISRIILNE